RDGGGGLTHRRKNPRIGAAPTDVAVQRLDDLLLRGVRVAGEQRGGRDDHAGSAIPALKCLFVEEGLLCWVESAVRSESLDRRDLGAGDFRDRGAAGTRRAAVDENRAGAALPFAAAVLGSGQVESVSKYGEQAFFGRCVDRVL